MSRNIPMFTRLMNQLADHPDLHDQTEWETTLEERREWDPDTEVCGTTRCFAGWTIHFWGVDQGLGHLPLDGITGAYMRSHPELSPIGWYSSAAADILGLGPDEANQLFAGSLDPEVAFELVSGYARGEL